MTLEEFKKKFETIKCNGFTRSMRKGPTGVGHTLEHLLGLNENNLALPDIKKIEIKAHRENSGSLITLFTFNKKAWLIPPLDAINKYGSADKNGRMGLYYTLSIKPNSAGLFLNTGDDSIFVQHTSGEKIAAWQLETLAQRFTQKIPALLLVSAHTEERDGEEYFHFYRCQLMSDTSPDILLHLFKTEILLVDLRLHAKLTSARNHGTGFRVHENKLHLLFKNIRDI